MAYSSHPCASSVRPLCDSQYREAAIRAVNQAEKQLANSSFEAELARLDHEYKLKQVKLQESYLAATAHANISIVTSSVTLPSTSPAVFPTCSRQFSNNLHYQDPIAAPSVSPMSNCLPPASHYPVPPSHQNSRVSLLPPHIAQQSYTVHGSPQSHYPVPPSHQNSRVSLLPPHIAQQSYTAHCSPQLHYPSSTPPLPGISSIPPTTCLSQDSFFPSQSFSTVYPNAPMSQGYPKSQFPFSQHLSDSVSISSHPPNSCISNSVHVDTSVPPPSFPPTHNLDFNVPMLHKMTNPSNPHCKLSELFSSNISINVSSSSSSGSSFEPHSASQVSSLDSQVPASTCLEPCTLETSSPPQLSSDVIHDDKDMTEVASDSYFIQDEILSISDSSVQESSSVQGTCSVQESSSVQQTCSVQESSDHHIENVIPVKLCDKPELSLNDDASSLCLFDPHGSLVLDLSVSKDYKHPEDELFDIGHCYLVTQLFYHIQLHKLCSFQQFYVTESYANCFRYYWFPDKSSRGIDLKSVKGDIIQFTSSLFSHSIDVVIFICIRLT